MKVWRVENAAGIGPYHANVVWDGEPDEWDGQLQQMLEYEHADQPVWDNDGIIFLSPADSFEYLSGFATLDALFEWFDGWLTTLVTCGFSVVQYEAKFVKFGGQQLAFVPERRL